jgi:hypothetical protein
MPKFNPKELDAALTVANWGTKKINADNQDEDSKATISQVN